MFTKTLTPMTPDEVRNQEALVSMAAKEEFTELDELAATLNSDVVARVRKRADAVVIAKQHLQNGAALDDPSQTMVENLADAIMRRRGLE